MKSPDKSTQIPGEEQKRMFSGDLKCTAGANCSGSGTDDFGNNIILIKVGLSETQFKEIERLQELGNKRVQLVLFTAMAESSSPEESQKKSFNPVEQKVKINYSITPCEQIVLEGLAKGYTYEKIADYRCRSVNTVKRQASDGYCKLGVHNKLDAAVKLKEFIKIVLLFYLAPELFAQIQSLIII